MKFFKYFCLSLVGSLALGILAFGIEKSIDSISDFVGKHLSYAIKFALSWLIILASSILILLVIVFLFRSLIEWFRRRRKHEPVATDYERDRERAIKYVEEMSKDLERLTDIYASKDGRFLSFAFSMPLSVWKASGTFFDEDMYESYPDSWRTEAPTLIYVFLMRDDNPATPLHLTPFRTVPICPFRNDTVAHQKMLFELTGQTRKRWKLWATLEESITEAEWPVLTPVLGAIFGYQVKRNEDRIGRQFQPLPKVSQCQCY